MPTPPARRRVHPAVAVRRAQSERRYLSPWQAGAAPPLLHVPPGSGWARFEHHHATRTAYIPPLHPRLCHSQGVGRPKVVMGVREVWTGTVSYHPCASMSRAQLPPLALGSPPAVAAPHTLLPPPITLEDRLAQDRLTAFLAAESLPEASIVAPRFQTSSAAQWVSGALDTPGPLPSRRLPTPCRFLLESSRLPAERPIPLRQLFVIRFL
ncbi:uncharacterized protein LOC125048347 [Penaeus chinensis]|uniref:uncharacterized protein LOC125048347 n=1 Tax=Penaeus chinensis TaxID=139456 RepID=UPI001FB6959D|nr:uncharacterized protein LOC125048347 [Penaeus chinensis]